MPDFFKLKEHGTTFQREILGGITTFLAMSYIIFVQPGVLKVAGMNFEAVLTATCLAAAAATLLMGLLANYPVALAPGMGENFFFAYTLCGTVPLGFGLTWQQALAAVLLAGLFFVAITLTGLRARIVNSIPDSLKCSIAAGIGLFITFIGLQYGGLVTAAPGTLVRMGDLRQPVVIATVAGLLIIIVLLSFQVRGAILLGILSSTAICLLLGLVHYHGIFSLQLHIAPTFWKFDLMGLLKTPPVLRWT